MWLKSHSDWVLNLFITLKIFLGIFSVPHSTWHWDYETEQVKYGPCPHKTYNLVSEIVGKVSEWKMKV